MTPTKPKPTGDQPEEKPQVNDVAKPGETPSLPTSRPIITSHGSMIKQDPMISDNTENHSDEASNPEPAKINKLENKLEPPSAQAEEKTETEQPPIEDSKVEVEQKSEATPPKPVEANDSKEDSPANTENNTPSADNDDAAAIDSLAASAEAKKVSAQETALQEEQNVKVQQLVAAKKYNVPIVEGGHRASSQRFITWLLLILLLAAIGAYIAIDAGYLDVGLELPYDLIKN